MRCILFASVALLLASCGSVGKKPKLSSQAPEQNAVKPADSHEPVEAATQVEMVNVNMHLDPELVLHILHLEGKFLSTKKDQQPTFDDKLSYIVAVDSGEVGVSMASMSHEIGR